MTARHMTRPSNMAASGSPQWNDRAEKLHRRLAGLLEADSDDPLLLKASATLQSLKDTCSRDTQNCNRLSCLRLYSQAILDITYYEENRLVDEEFASDDSLQKVQELIQIITEPESLAEENNASKQRFLLDMDVEECLHWRRGALLYMYCHTVGERENWNLSDQRTFHQCLKDGVYYLLKMLKTRNPVQLNNDISFKDINTATLLAKGIFSDVHVLALMYCGEMCFWALSYCSDIQPGSDSETHSKILNFKEVGEKVLDTYVSVCEGPLSAQGWNTENAKKILEFLKTR
ncbi:RAB7A-interacting MON1-CCZ1 complex subunit 1 [Aquarana catesbeiana]|uniref:RAB7A-interacting MON1-CCZ1 complex subunit 1 n=1 Tax=Aquarana catesbeiana TaxID=8400 RepID=UPI003CCA386B